MHIETCIMLVLFSTKVPMTQLNILLYKLNYFPGQQPSVLSNWPLIISPIVQPASSSLIGWAWTCTGQQKAVFFYNFSSFPWSYSFTCASVRLLLKLFICATLPIPLTKKDTYRLTYLPPPQTSNQQKGRKKKKMMFIQLIDGGFLNFQHCMIFVL